MQVKSILSLLLPLAFTSVCLAQTNTLPTSGNVGIGTTTPTTLLEINKAAQQGNGELLMRMGVTDAPGDHLTIRNSTLSNNQFIPTITGQRNSDDRFALIISGSISDVSKDSGTNALLAFDARHITGQINNRPLFVWTNYNVKHMTMLSNGNLGLGTTNPQAKLSVDGTILATEVKVKTNINVPDYVFEPDYALPSLAKVEAYVKEHKHLPEIPSAADIQRDGLDLAEMNLLLLKKVEEITLHLIRQEALLGQQQQQIHELQRSVTKD
ncbi:hypothetical protein [Parapedobacter tibetensis]|uniref:hypothetical protein n=1 Tax=Parapedobacter tibetensis TaxID=2972951 RepID=UPI00214DDC2E|nr:hypothetical protein [Parapedobacter tibetensis]